MRILRRRISRDGRSLTHYWAWRWWYCV